jgi:hypothetical protein
MKKMKWIVEPSLIETTRLGRDVFRLKPTEKLLYCHGTTVVLHAEDAIAIDDATSDTKGVCFLSTVSSVEFSAELRSLGWTSVEESIGLLRSKASLPIVDIPRMKSRFLNYTERVYEAGDETENVEALIQESAGWVANFEGSYHRAGAFGKEKVDATYAAWFADMLRNKSTIRGLAFERGRFVAAHTLVQAGNVWKSGFSFTAPDKLAAGVSSAVVFGVYPEFAKLFENYNMLSYMNVHNRSQQNMHMRVGFEVAHFRQSWCKVCGSR